MQPTVGRLVVGVAAKAVQPRVLPLHQRPPDLLVRGRVSNTHGRVDGHNCDQFDLEIALSAVDLLEPERQGVHVRSLHASRINVCDRCKRFEQPFAAVGNDLDNAHSGSAAGTDVRIGRERVRAAE